uniref:Uncharacterized protein n=1 Tax=Myotis myotis TaxID=51298 RepID=A0A7J7Y0V2_MYOMY|nr:hypothetical protein mMyoMyo1_011467 [Myotis myotis]
MGSQGGSWLQAPGLPRDRGLHMGSQGGSWLQAPGLPGDRGLHMGSQGGSWLSQSHVSSSTCSHRGASSGFSLSDLQIVFLWVNSCYLNLNKQLLVEASQDHARDPQGTGSPSTSSVSFMVAACGPSPDDGERRWHRAFSQTRV